MRYCKRCVTPDTRPRVEIDSEGICNACRHADKKKNDIDWKIRKKEFEQILDEVRTKDPMKYDCVVPGSGGKDSIYVAYRMKHDYGMNPLLVTYPVANDMYTAAGKKNIEIFRTRLGIDHITFTPNTEVDKKLLKKFFIMYGDPYLPWSKAVHTLPVKVALAFNIRLIVYGEPPSEYGGPELARMSVKSVKEIAKTGSVKDITEPENWPSLFEDGSVKLSDLKPYIYPAQEELDKANITAVYFGYYHYWDPYENYKFCKEQFDWNEHDYRFEGSWMNHYSLDDKMDTFYQYLMLLKFGISRAQKEAAPLIRAGHLTKEEFMQKIKDVYYEFPYRYLRECMDWLGMSENEFFGVLEKFRNRDIWERVNGEWRVKSPPWKDTEGALNEKRKEAKK